jgi:hypothetical protein
VIQFWRIRWVEYATHIVKLKKKMLHIFHLENSSKAMWRFGHRWENSIKVYHKTKNHVKMKARLTELRIRPMMNFHECSKVFKNLTST